MKISNLKKIMVFGFLGNFFFERSIWMIFLQAKGLSMYEISILQMALNITMFLFEVPSGILSDKFGRKPPAFLGISFSIIYLIGMLYLNEFFYLVIVFIVYGIGISLLSGVDQSLIYEQLDYYGKQEIYHKTIGFYNAISIAALAVSALVGGWLAENKYWELIFYFGVLFQLMSLLFLYFIKDFYKLLPHNNKVKKSFFGIGILRVDGKVLFIICILGIFQGVFSSVVLYYQKVLDYAGVSIFYISILYSLSFVFSSFSSVMSGFVSEKIGEVKAVLLFSLLLLFSFVLSLSLNIGLLIVTFFVVLICYEIIDTSLGVILNHMLTPEIRGTYLSITNSLCAFVMTASFMIIGILSRYFEFSSLIFAYGIITILLYLSVFFIYKKKIVFS